MEPLPLLEILSDDAAILADWWAVAHDLDHVIAATKMLYEALQAGQDDGPAVRALWTSALVAYIRCFGSGKRIRLDPVIFFSLPGQPLETHQWYKDTRDKHIAHAVNGFEEVRVGVAFDASNNPVAVGHLQVFLSLIHI